MKESNADKFPKGVSAPALRALAAAGVFELTQLTHVSEQKLAAMHGMGPKVIGILKVALAEKGLRLADD